MINPSSASFPFGAVYLLEPEYPWREVERDVSLMEEQGFNLLTLWPVANAWLAPSASSYVFDDTRRFLDLCATHRMKVVLQLIGQNPSQEFMPDCLVEPGMRVNVPGISWPNLNHPKVAAEVARYLDACVTALKGHPATFAWNVFNEANFRSDDPWTTAAYRAWLQRKYGSIDALNRRWHRRFNCFSQVDPADRTAFYSAWSSLLPQVDYEAFHAANLSDLCRGWCDQVRRLDPSHPVVVDGSSALLLEADVSIRNNDEFEIASVCDVFGGTFYPKSWGRDLGRRPWDLLLYYGVPRGAAVKAGKRFFVSELQTHTQSLLTPGSEVSPDDLKLYIWAAIAAGGEAIQLWRWRPFLRGCQVTGRGLTNLNGQVNPRAAIVKSVLTRLRQYESILTSFKPCRADVTILLSYRSRLFHDAVLRGAPNDHPGSVKGWHRLFVALGLSVEIGSLDDPTDRDRRSPIIVVPCAVSVAEPVVDWLVAYVREGGCLVGETRLNALDDCGMARSEGLPGEKLSRVFGVMETDVGPAGRFTWRDVSVAAPFMVQHLEIGPGADVLAHDAHGHPMIVRNRFGRGQAFYFASLQGCAWQADLNAELVELVRIDLVQGLGLEPHAVEKSEAAVARWHEHEGRQLAYILNFGDEPAVVRFAGSAGWRVRELGAVEELLTARVVVAPRDVRLLLWEPRDSASDHRQIAPPHATPAETSRMARDPLRRHE